MESENPEVKETFSIHTQNVRTLCFSPDQTKLCSAGYDEKVILTNLENNQTEKTFSVLGVVYGSDFSSNGRFVAVGCEYNIVHIWKVSGSESQPDESGNSTELEGHVGEVNFVHYLRNDPNRVISGSDDGTIKIWNIERKKEISSLLCCEQDPVLGCDTLHDGLTLVSGDGENKIRIWDLRSGKCVHTLDHHKDEVSSVQFHTNTYSLASGSDDMTIKILDYRTPFQLLQNYQEHSDWVNSICFHPSGKYLLSGSCDYTVKLLDVQRSEKKVLFTLKDHSDYVLCVQFSPDGKLFASGSSDKKVLLWNFPLGRMIREDKDIDQEERVKYLVDRDLLVDDVCEDSCCERNVLKIRIDNYCSLFSYKFLM